MTSSTASNSIIASLARNAPSHRSILTPRSIFRARAAQVRRVRSLHRRQNSSAAHQNAPVPVTIPAVDLNNNNSNTTSVPLITTEGSAITLDRVAILKAFAASQSSDAQSADSSTTMSSVPQGRVSRYEKPTSYREARRLSRLHHQTSLTDPAIEQEFVRLRETVPSIAGSNASDLTIINEAISLICDLESQLLRKLKCQSLPAAIQTVASK